MLKLITFLSIALITASCANSTDRKANLTTVKISVRVGEGWSYTDPDLKREYRKELEIYESNAWLIQKILGGLRLEPSPPPILISSETFTLITKQDHQKSEFKMLIGDNQLEAIINDSPLEILLKQNGASHKIATLSKPPLSIIINLTERNSVLIYSLP
jgi:hypothetical protein